MAGSSITQVTGTLVLVVRDGTPLPNALVITNTAAISDSSGLTAQSSVSYTVFATHSLAITKSVTGIALPGELLTYTIAYAITGNEPANNVTIDELTPPNTKFVSASPNATVDPGVGNMGNVRWSLGNFLAAGSGLNSATGVVTLVVRVDGTLPPTITQIVNTAVIIDASGQAANSTVTVTVPADVVVEKIASGSEAFAGSNITYTIVVSNNGPGLAQNVVVTESLPSNTIFVSATSGYVGTHTLVWALGDMQPGQRITLEMVVQSPSVSSGRVVNTVRVGTSSPETTTSNNASSTTVTVGLPILTLSKRSSPPLGFIIRPGDRITYTLMLTNSGAISATNVVITDQLPVDTTIRGGQRDHVADE